MAWDITHNRIADWLKNDDGYKVTSPPPHHEFYYELLGILAVAQLEKLQGDGSIACVQIVICGCCMLYVILSFHSSEVPAILIVLPK